MQYYCATFNTADENHEALVALLGEEGFEMFQEEYNRLSAYIPADYGSFDQIAINIKNIPDEIKGSRWELILCPDKNWNEEWERSFAPVEIEGKLRIRAPFHSPSDDHIMDIIIEPKMSFGTGHHPTTELMMRAMLENDFKGKSVVDIGCGSGILSIQAAKSGALSVVAVDIDDWAVENTRENCQRNECESILVSKGNINTVKNQQADRLLANINRNILLQDLMHYANMLLPGGLLFMSGFLKEDAAVIINAALSNNLKSFSSLELDNWMMLSFIKPL